MSDNSNENPFLGLFSTSDEVDHISIEIPKTLVIDKLITDNKKIVQNEFKHILNDTNENKEDKVMDKIIEDVFGLVLSSKTPISSQPLISVESHSIEDAIFERLTLPDIKTKLVTPLNSPSTDCDPHFFQDKAIFYLFECFLRLDKYPNDDELRDTINRLKQVTIKLTVTILALDLSDQKIYEQFMELFANEQNIAQLLQFSGELIKSIIKEYPEDANKYIEFVFLPVLMNLNVQILNNDSLIFPQRYYDILLFIVNIEPLAKLLLRDCTPVHKQGSAYATTILGIMLSTSCLPRILGEPFPFFNKPFGIDFSTEQENIWKAWNIHIRFLHKLFHSLLKCSPEVRHMTLDWLGKCLHANASRGKLWSSESTLGMSSVVSDGFMLNLGNVLLRLCKPFCTNFDEKIPKIDPTYCAAEPKDEEESHKRGIHMQEMSKVTCLVPVPEGESRPVAKEFGFVTEIFYLTHRALDLGYRVVLDKFLKLTHELDRIRQDHEFAESQANLQIFELMEMRRKVISTKYFSYRTSVLEPKMLNLLCNFHAATAFWLIQVNVNKCNCEDYNKETFYPEEVKTITFPLPEDVPHTLRCIPEFVVGNTIDFICFLRRLDPNTFEIQNSNFFNSLLTEIIALMESPKRLFNPHLRAHLAEELESFLPDTEETNNRNQATLGTFRREQLFLTHPHRQFIIPNLLQVFVSLEMTGQNVQFEQKFNYRLPMYEVMKYLWKIDEYRKIFQCLAQEAEENIEAVQPPIFLRFINLLMNDAIFLLDEALSNMAQLKQMLQALDNREWNRSPARESEQQMAQLLHIGMIARFDNILGRETISALKMLTSEIKSIFCHSTMVDRIASMLNYLLLQLVGPNQRNLKVKDQKKYEFNPAQLVLNICEIYINLGRNKNFILAVSQDGRSYKPNLFQLANNVLVRIGGIDILEDLENLAKEVAKAASIKKEEDEILSNVPDEFLDPIMSTLMTDPVILPASKVIVDRQTIARHLLSDQTDPFNRSPLTMDMIKSDEDLRKRIKEWISSKTESQAAIIEK
ncbi:ubiquitin conjugation factor E4 A [Chelonus insularis]|uniref:ubiquitin conjugation factor E4 A n=1 Tax=Chelonus insularis TaxID=460826 RepID=UPI0015889B7C|nr:ubiquitin conjugation factor E4 A [Chelonus insularis]XP_034950371.1 ubiquitin conjugation factor E4 A [Chelonus insularis]